MNVELCKKCLNQESIVFKIKKFHISFLSLNNCDGTILVYGDSNSRRFNIAHCCKSVCFREGVLLERSYKKPKYFDCVALFDHTCPYFLEHQLYDWNTENEQRALQEML